MQIGYARVSTKEQSFDLQVDALHRAGCAKVFQEVVSGAKAERTVLEGLLATLRPGDVLVIWKLDRLGRSLRHLVELAATLMEQEVGLRSLNDPIDTTTPQGRLAFNRFASLAEFERDLIRERTQADPYRAALSASPLIGWPPVLSHHGKAGFMDRSLLCPDPLPVLVSPPSRPKVVAATTAVRPSGNAISTNSRPVTVSPVVRQSACNAPASTC